MCPPKLKVEKQDCQTENPDSSQSGTQFLSYLSPVLVAPQHLYIYDTVATNLLFWRQPFITGICNTSFNVFENAHIY